MHAVTLHTLQQIQFQLSGTSTPGPHLPLPRGVPNIAAAAAAAAAGLAASPAGAAGVGAGTGAVNAAEAALALDLLDDMIASADIRQAAARSEAHSMSALAAQVEQALVPLHAMMARHRRERDEARKETVSWVCMGGGWHGVRGHGPGIEVGNSRERYKVRTANMGALAAGLAAC